LAVDERVSAVHVLSNSEHWTPNGTWLKILYGGHICSPYVALVHSVVTNE